MELSSCFATLSLGHASPDTSLLASDKSEPKALFSDFAFSANTLGESYARASFWEEDIPILALAVSVVLPRKRLPHRKNFFRKIPLTH